MTVFHSDAEVYEILGRFFENSAQNEEIGPAIYESQLVIQFRYTDPDSVVTIDTVTPQDGRYFRVITGEADVQPDVVLSMKADVAHQFWLGKVNLLAAITRRQIVAKGPIPKILKLLPAIQPAYQLYPKYLEEIGRAELNTI